MKDYKLIPPIMVDDTLRKELLEYNDSIDYINIVVKYKDGEITVGSFKDWQDLNKHLYGINRFFKEVKDLKLKINKGE